MQLSRTDYVEFYRQAAKKSQDFIDKADEERKRIEINLKDFQDRVSRARTDLSNGEFQFSLAKRNYDIWHDQQSTILAAEEERLAHYEKASEKFESELEFERLRIAVIEGESEKLADLLGLQ